MSAALDRLSELEAEATPGPWKAVPATDELMAGVETPEDDFGVERPADAALVAASRNALAGLIAVARAADKFAAAWLWTGEDDADCLACTHDALRAALDALEGRES